MRMRIGLFLIATLVASTGLKCYGEVEQAELEKNKSEVKKLSKQVYRLSKQKGQYD